MGCLKRYYKGGQYLRKRDEQWCEYAETWLWPLLAPFHLHCLTHASRLKLFPTKVQFCGHLFRLELCELLTKTQSASRITPQREAWTYRIPKESLNQTAFPSNACSRHTSCWTSQSSNFNDFCTSGALRRLLTSPYSPQPKATREYPAQVAPARWPVRGLGPRWSARCSGRPCTWPPPTNALFARAGGETRREERRDAERGCEEMM